MPLRIVHYNNPVLRKKGVKVTAFNAELTELAREMIDLMHQSGGIGLAAQQIGRAIQVCVLDLLKTDRDFDWEIDGAKPPLELIMPLVVVNPVLKVHPEFEDIVEEGCLSFPEIRGEVCRPEQVTVNFQDAQGVAHVITCNGLFARCLQHEIDHLNGVLFIDRMEKKVRSGIDKAVKDLAKKTRESTPEKPRS
ncbi:MAG TPA: peptide deformylase [Opitutaceae bacterium]